MSAHAVLERGLQCFSPSAGAASAASLIGATWGTRLGRQGKNNCENVAMACGTSEWSACQIVSMG